jgi:hypothetical protein
MTNLPPPIPYRSPERFRPTGDPWSPIPVLIAAELLTVLITLISALICLHFEPVFRQYRVEIPAITKAAIFVSEVIWFAFAWVPLLLVSTLVPLLVIPRLRTPTDKTDRRRIVRRTRTIFTVAYLLVAAFAAFSLLVPMIALINSTAGPKP